MAEADDKQPQEAPPSQSRRARVTESIKSRQFPIRRIIPNMVTLAALCLGLTAVRQGLEGRFELAVMCIVIAGFLDAFDGRLARLLKAESPLGAQLDSLTDFVNFGIAPVLLVYLWALQSIGRLGWAVILVYSVCCALRLARFNVDMEEADRPAWKTKFFIGVPSPSAGGLVMTPIYLQVAGIVDLANYPIVILANTILVGLLMVSTLPTFSGKGLTHIRRDLVLPLMLFIGFTAVMLFTFPWLTLIAMAAAYYLMLPVSSFAYWHYKQA